MTLGFAFLTFINAWWIALFAVIPFHVDFSQQGRDRADYVAAPTRINWKKICLRTTLVAALLTLALALLLESGIVPLRDGVPLAPIH
jgi:predicted secreted protein